MVYGSLLAEGLVARYLHPRTISSSALSRSEFTGAGLKIMFNVIGS